MNEEYLWQKTGDDGEIKHLEKALAVFRYDETAPPPIIVPAGRSSIRRWQFPFAVSAVGFAALLLAAGIWLHSVIRDGSDDVTFIYHPAPEQPVARPMIGVPASQGPSRPPAGDVDRDMRPTTVSAPRRPVVRKSAGKRGPVVLTKQERDAYEQVLIALSISSSKLNIVRDTINGVSEKDSAAEVNNR